MPDNTYAQSRREFLKLIGISAPVMAIGGMSLPGCSSSQNPSIENLYKNFRNPPAEARPFFRWWWNGNAVTKSEISRELRLMKNAGAGGIEINPIAFPEQLPDPPKDCLSWLSDEWCEIVRFTANESQKNGMLTDLIVGTGWPFGGEFLTPEETIKGITVETQQISGKPPFTIRLRDEDPHEELYKISLIPANIKDTKDIIETDRKPDSNNELQLDIPAGKYTLVVLRIKSGFRQVFRGAPGGAGPVLDHFNRESVQKYLNRMTDKLNPSFDGSLGNGLRAMFCDSIELQGANWTTGLPEEFKQRRGYEIGSYLPLLMLKDQSFLPEDIIEKVRRVRYDLSYTLAEIFMENFILTFHNWCHENNVLSRYQAYGMPWLYTDLVAGYMVPDIPEGDQWLYSAGWTYSKINQIRYAIWNKYASSGGNLSGRNIVSSEAMTNTSGVFKATLAYMKQAADLDFICGVNHLVLHGFNYSPPEAGFPGWVQYGTYFNEHNPWWPYLSKFMEYVGRLSSVFQTCEPVSQVAILGPTPDIWRNYGLDRNYFNLTPWYLHSLWQALSNHGIPSEYINGSVLKNAIFENKKIRFNNIEFDTLIVCQAETMEEPVARSILQFTEAGGKVIFLDSVPDRSPGMENREEFDRIVRDTMQRVVDLGAHVRPGPEKSENEIMENMTRWTGLMINELQIKPGLEVNNPDPYVFLARYKQAGYPVVFVANTRQDHPVHTEIRFNEDVPYIWSWDPETGMRNVVDKTDQGTVELDLGILKSVLLIGSHSGSAKPVSVQDVYHKEYILAGPWELELIPKIESTSKKMNLGELRDLSLIPELNNFSGTAVYRKSFKIDTPDYKLLELGKVFDIADIKLNGKEIGVSWYGDRKIEITDMLIPGMNQIEIRVTNTLFNFCLSKTNDPVIGFWISRNRDKDILHAGLLGPVKFML